MTGRQGRRRRKLLDDLKERRGYSHLKEEALDRTMWRARFGRGFGPVVSHTTKWRNVIRWRPPTSRYLVSVYIHVCLQLTWWWATLEVETNSQTIKYRKVCDVCNVCLCVTGNIDKHYGCYTNGDVPYKNIFEFFYAERQCDVRNDESKYLS